MARARSYSSVGRLFLLLGCLCVAEASIASERTYSAPTVWTYPQKPSLEILASVSAVVLSPSGTTYILDSEKREVVAIDASGARDLTFDAAGLIPRTLKSPVDMFLMRDTLAIVDASSIFFFTSKGTYAGQWKPKKEPGSYVLVRGLSLGDDLLVSTYEPNETAESMRVRILLGIYGRDGALKAKLVENGWEKISGKPFDFYEEDDESLIYFDACRDGSIVVSPIRSQYEALVFDRAGSRTCTITRHIEPVPRDSDTLDWIRQRLTEAFGSRVHLDEFERRILQVACIDGEIWIRPASADAVGPLGTLAIYDVFDLEGRQAGRVRIQKAVLGHTEIFPAGGNTLYVVEYTMSDSDGGSRVAIPRLRRCRLESERAQSGSGKKARNQ